MAHLWKRRMVELCSLLQPACHFCPRAAFPFSADWASALIGVVGRGFWVVEKQKQVAVIGVAKGVG